MRVLYVEDNATNVILVQRVANMGKHEVINYADGQDALDHFEQDKPDLILLDIQLRGALTGLDVARILRTRACVIPVIAVTAYAMKGDRQRCLDAGCDDYLAKPISVAELVTVFKRFGDAIASGKPILSTYKLPAVTPVPTLVPKQAETPVLATAPVDVVPPADPVSAPEITPTTLKAADAPIVTAPVDPVPSATPTPAAPSSTVTIGDVPVVTAPVDPVAYRAPTPLNAEP